MASGSSLFDKTRLVTSHMHLPFSTHTAAVLSVAGLLLYPIICRALRFHRLTAMRRKYRYGTSEHPSYTGMTDNEAQEILQILSELEFPAIYYKSLQLALFRTYGISTIANLLVKTQQLLVNPHLARRYVDTQVLMTEIYSNPPSDERTLASFARLNYLHGHYVKQGKISNDDLLYTLAMFMTQPWEWIDRYEWRKLTPLEVCALGTFHKSMGDAMEINYDVLPGSKTGWRDGLHFFQELEDWRLEYEKRMLLPNAKSNETAERTTDHMLRAFPVFSHNVIRKFITAAMDDRLRESIMYKTVSPTYPKVFNALLVGRQWLLRHLALPRPSFLRFLLIAPDPKPGERRHSVALDAVPVYVKPTFTNRWGPGALMSRLIGCPLPGDEYTYPEGYLIEEIGPITFLGKGKVEMQKTKDRLRKERTGGSPFKNA